MFSRLVTVGFLVAVSVPFAATVFAQDAAKPSEKPGEKRTWTDTTGKFKIEATFVKQEGEQVELKRIDGKTVKLPLAKLCTADQEFIKKLDTENDPDNPFKVEEDSDNPFKSVAPAAKPAMPSGGLKAPAKPNDPFSNPDDDLVRISPVKNASGASELIIDAPASFKYVPDPAPVSTTTTPNRGFKLSQLPPEDFGNSTEFWDHVKGIVFDDAKQQALVGFLFEQPGKPKKTRIERLDLAKGVSLGVLEAPVNFVPVDYDPVTQLILGCSDNTHHGTRDRLDIWEVAGESLKHQLSFKPYDTGKQHGRKDITWAKFVGANHIGTLGGDNRFVLWETKTLKPVYAATLWASSEPALSAQGKYLALITKDGAYVLESQTGNVVAKLTGQPGYFPKLSFRPDGKQLACASYDRLTVWDMTTGEIASEVYYPQLMSPQEILWPEDGAVLVSSGSMMKLIDLEKKVVLWTYNMGEPTVQFGGRIWSVLAKHGEGKTLVHIQMPDVSAKAMQKSLAGQDLLALKPGGSVGVFINVALGEPERVKIYNHILAQLKEAGINVDQNSPVSIEAATEQGETESVTYESYDRRFGPRFSPFGPRFGGGEGEKANVTKLISRITIREKGNVLWEAKQIVGAPHHITQKEGQSLQQAINETTTPNAAYFLSLNMPKQLARHPKGGTYGTSTLTPQGLK